MRKTFISLALAALSTVAHAASTKPYLFGAANAAFQVEGAPLDSDWYRFTHTKGKIADGTTADKATDFWNRYDEDFAIAQKNGMNAFRISIAWERIEPKKGVWDDQALAHYQGMIKALHSRGLEPVVTLHHFVNPGWLADEGGLLAKDFPTYFARFAEHVMRGIVGVKYWMTFNEPMVLVNQAYLFGVWPPQHADYAEAERAAAQLAKAHIAAVAKVRPHLRNVKISIAKNWGVYDAGDDTPQTKAVQQGIDQWFNHQFVSSLMTGHLYFNVPGQDTKVDETVALPDGKPTLDYLGINQYGRTMVKWIPKAPFIERYAGPGPQSDLGWEIYPDGLYRAIKAASVYGLPILVSENGIADHRDKQRAQFLEEHFKRLDRAVKEGLPLMGYLHWSLTDNYEWAYGLKPRFGLVEIDYATATRKPRRSLDTYRELIARFRKDHE